MNINGICGMMSNYEMDVLHHSAMDIIANLGIKIENEELLEIIREGGGMVDKKEQVVRFSRECMEKFLAEATPYEWSRHSCHVKSVAAIFEGKFLSVDEEYVPWSEDLISLYAKFAHYLENVDHAVMLGCPIAGLDKKLIPLYQRLYSWKYGITSGASIWDRALCPYILEMAEIVAEDRRENVDKFLNLAVYLISPLRLGKEEASHLMWFADRGVRVNIQTMSSMGGTAPVTLAGAVSLYLAEVLLINIIQSILYGDRELSFHCSISVMDMRRGSFCYGRPEKSMANLMMAQMARYYKSSFRCQSGQCDAKHPGYEAAAQKSLLAIPSLIFGGSASISAGLLSVDEVSSPIQMICDNELTGALRRFAKGCSFGNEDVAMNEIKTTGIGGMFTDKDHTFEHFKEELWGTRMWSSESLSSWLASGAVTEAHRAQDCYYEIAEKKDPDFGISSDCERELLNVISKASKSI